MSELCSCGSQRSFIDCCGPYLAGDALAPTAEALMRSRYSAFCKSNLDYLIATHHPTQHQQNDRQSLRQSLNSTKWLNLVVLKTQKGTAKDTTGIVEFACAYRPKTKLSIVSTAVGAGAGRSHIQSNIQQMHERSKFVKEGGQWFYTTGDRLPPYQPKKSHPCWCGSGKKFKHCHG
ncbi:MAG: YchJ family metal-binding protein [Cyanobacteria bacterium J06598_3]